jgi:hypothetical protein
MRRRVTVDRYPAQQFHAAIVRVEDIQGIDARMFDHAGLSQAVGMSLLAVWR